jgi:hypothetical protein
MNTRKDFQSKLVNRYTHMHSEKVKRATITLENNAEYPILMVSFDREADHESIIMDKILPIITKKGGGEWVLVV